MADTGPLRGTGNLDPAVLARLQAQNTPTPQQNNTPAQATPQSLPKPAMTTDRRSPTGPLSALPNADPFSFEAPPTQAEAKPEEKPSIGDQEATWMAGESKEMMAQRRELAAKRATPPGTTPDVSPDATPTGNLGKVAEVGKKSVAGVAVAQGLTEALGALSGNPVDMPKALEALSGVIQESRELLTTGPMAKTLGVVGGALMAVEGGKAVLDKMQELMKDGRMPTASEMAGLAADALKAVGGLCMAIAPFAGPAGPAIAAVGGAAFIGSAAAGLTKLAIDNWDTIKQVASDAWNDPVGSANKALEAGKQAVSDAADSVKGAVASAWGWLTGSNPAPAPQPT